jgi:lipopolysaccharide transport system permease protein
LDKHVEEGQSSSIRGIGFITSVIRIITIIIKHRWLILELVKREVKVRYRGTWLGFFWSLLNPLIMTGVYTVVFSFVFRVDIPKYSAFLFCGLLPWTWFNEAMNSGTSCLTDRVGFVRDAVFPSEILPITSIAVGMMNYIFSLPILLIILLVFKVTLTWTLLFLPLIMAIQFLFSLGMVYILSTFNVFFRDLRYIVQNLLMAVFFLTPVMYAISTIPVQFQWVFKLNPMAHIINDYRNILFFSTWPDWRDMGIVVGITLVLLILGAWAFESHRESFAEYL